MKLQQLSCLLLLFSVLDFTNGRFRSSIGRGYSRFGNRRPGIVKKPVPFFVPNPPSPPPPTSPPTAAPGACATLPTGQTTATILVEFIGRPDDLTDTELSALQAALLESYNSLIFCEEDGLRQIINIQLQQIVDAVPTASRNLQVVSAANASSLVTGMSVTRGFSLRFQLVIECRGCSQDIVVANDGFRRQLEGVKSVSQDDERQLITRQRGFSQYHFPRPQSPPKTKEPAPAPVCPLCVAPDVGDIVLAFDSTVQSLASEGVLPSIDAVTDVTELEPFDCDPNYRIQKSTFVFDIEADRFPTKSDLKFVEQAVIDSYNGLNALDPDVCDPLFREIMEANVQVVKNFTFSRRQRRRLQASSRSTNFTFASGSATVGYSFLTGFTFGFRGLDRELTVTAGDNDGIQRRRSLSFHRLIGNNNIEKERNLQTVENDCVCAPDATVFRPPTTEELNGAFQESLQVLAVQGSISFRPIVLDTTEVDPVPCPRVKSGLETLVSLDFLGFPKNLTKSNLRGVENCVFDTYNRLARENCDPLFRVITDADIIGRPFQLLRPISSKQASEPGSLRAKAFLFRLNLRVEFRCRGCTRGSAIFDYPSADNDRNLATALPGGKSNSVRSLGLEGGGDTCFCDANAVNDRAPTKMEFEDAFAAGLEAEFDIPALVEFVQVIETKLPYY